MKINVSKNKIIYYKQQPGVVIGEKFLSKEEFKNFLKNDLSPDRKKREQLQAKINENRKMSIEVDTLDTAKFEKGLHDVAQAFIDFMGGLGGTVSLLTTFSFGKRTQRTYFLPEEAELSSVFLSRGELLYINTRKSLVKLEEKITGTKLLEENLKRHFRNFSNQLQNPQAYSQENFQALRKWSQKYLKKRYVSYSDESANKVSYSEYFWGQGKIQGFISEAYGTHLALAHPEAFSSQVKRISHSVIEEHGGFGSTGLFELLASTKGQTPSWSSGDTVVVDNQGNVKFNIQSKASIKTKYPILLQYKEFFSNMASLLDFYDDVTKRTDENIDALFNMFKTSAWVPIEQDLEKNVDLVTDEILTQFDITKNF